MKSADHLKERQRTLTIVLEEELLHLTFVGLIAEFLLEADNSLANCLTDGQDLGSGTTTTDADANVQLCELVGTEKEDGLIHLQAHRRWLQKLERLSVHADESLAVGDVSYSGCVLLASKALDLVLFYLICHFSFFDMCVYCAS